MELRFTVIAQALTALYFLLKSTTTATGVRPIQRIDDHDTAQAPLLQHGLTQQEEDATSNSAASSSSSTNFTTLLEALQTMQSHFFMVSSGDWPHAIDWTATVMGTHVSATLNTISALSPSSSFDPQTQEWRDQENLINRYFTQLTSFYFGENAFSLRTQAYDDMLWVVLDWLEAVKFVKSHSALHYAHENDDFIHGGEEPSEEDAKNVSKWYGHQFIPQFAHRARLFYDIASRGYDTTLCGGGMVWNPYLAPYKNAITNQLFIAASASMYLHFPGDFDSSPFWASWGGVEAQGKPPAKAHDQRYLSKAITAYDWLRNSGMRNHQGLYVDGFHIQGWRGKNGADQGSNGTGRCDVRDEKVYTYNQGVVLSGLRWLWQATGNITYLEDGHDLIRNVIAATGFEDHDRYRWAGLGRDGVMEEACDWSGMCNQNGQAFKGIYFHHFSVFCEDLPIDGEDAGAPWLRYGGSHSLHRQSCTSYTDWVVRNAEAAVVTKDRSGIFGEWWGRPARQQWGDDGDEGVDNLEKPGDEGTDYRNDGVPKDELWQLPTPENYEEDYDDIDCSGVPPELRIQEGHDEGYDEEYDEDYVEENDEDFVENYDEENDDLISPYRPICGGTVKGKPSFDRDINDRGRGRTVETQSGGLAVVRAMWKLVHGSKAENDLGSKPL